MGALQAPLSMGFPGQDYCTGLPCPPPGDLPHPGMEPMWLSSAGGFFTAEPPGKPPSPWYKMAMSLGSVLFLSSQALARGSLSFLEIFSPWQLLRCLWDPLTSLALMCWPSAWNSPSSLSFLYQVSSLILKTQLRGNLFWGIFSHFHLHPCWVLTFFFLARAHFYHRCSHIVLCGVCVCFLLVSPFLQLNCAHIKTSAALVWFFTHEEKWMRWARSFLAFSSVVQVCSPHCSRWVTESACIVMSSDSKSVFVAIAGPS